MTSVRRLFDIRDGEGRPTLGAFSVLLLLIAGHTVVETTRDAMFLAKLPVSRLTIVYVAVAILSLAFGRVSTRIGQRLGMRTSFVVSLCLASVVTVVLFLLRHHALAILALYVLSGVFGAIAVPQFWAIVGGTLTATQGRRLFGLIAAAGVLGGVLGSVGAALVVQRWPVSRLLLVASAIFAVTALLISLAPARSVDAATDPAPTPNASALGQDPFLLRIALLVGLMTATVLVVDYLFKASIAQSVPAHQLGVFFARFNAALNIASLVMQLLVASAVVRRLGVASAAAIMPLLFVVGAMGTVVVGGTLAAVVILKACDGSLRHSIHRITTELLYLPVPSRTRAVAKPLIDGALSRIVQAVTALLLFALATLGVSSPRILAAIVAVLAGGWLAVALSMRKPYLALFRRALAEGLPLDPVGPEELDLRSAELVVERLASPDASEVVAAIQVLARWGRTGLLPALILHHDDAAVLQRSLEVLGASSRTDWMELAERLLDDPRAEVRLAATRALVARDPKRILSRATADGSPRTRAYAMLCFVVLATEEEPLDSAAVQDLLATPGESAVDIRLGLLDAATDVPNGVRVRALLVRLTRDATVLRSRELLAMLTRAIANAADPVFVPFLLERLMTSSGRDTARQALALVGAPAFEAVASALRDPALDRRLRVHLPRTLARFANQAASDILLVTLESDGDGLVRYKALRGLGRLVADHGTVVNRQRVEKLALKNLAEHLRLMALRDAIAEEDDDKAVRLLAGILDDKVRQSLERAFRLIKIAHPSEDLHRVQAAALGEDRRRRATAMEFLSSLLDRFDERALRSAVAAIVDDLPRSERIVRGASALGLRVPRTPGEVALSLVNDSDLTVAALASQWAARQRIPEVTAALTRAQGERPDLLEAARGLAEEAVIA